MKGWRKFTLGLVYMAGCFGCVAAAVWNGEAALVGAVAASAVSISTGLGVIVWGNIQEHRAAANGGPGPV